MASILKHLSSVPPPVFDLLMFPILIFRKTHNWSVPLSNIIWRNKSLRFSSRPKIKTKTSYVASRSAAYFRFQLEMPEKERFFIWFKKKTKIYVLFSFFPPRQVRATLVVWYRKRECDRFSLLSEEFVFMLMAGKMKFKIYVSKSHQAGTCGIPFKIWLLWRSFCEIWE